MMAVKNDCEDYLKAPLCMYEKCIDCPLLFGCKKDENEYDVEKVKEYIDKHTCPKCGLTLVETTSGKPVCLMCLVEEEWMLYRVVGAY